MPFNNSSQLLRASMRGDPGKAALTQTGYSTSQFPACLPRKSHEVGAQDPAELLEYVQPANTYLRFELSDFRPQDEPRDRSRTA